MPGKKTDTPFRYNGFPSPNGTVVPDDVFDVLAPLLSEAELRVLLYIIRRTFGFKKEADSISLSQMVDGITTRDGRVLDSGTGMSRRGVMKGCTGLVEKKVIRVEKRLSDQGDNEINVYHLRFRGDPEESDAPNATDPGVGNNVPYRREQRSPGVGNNVPPQQTVKQQTERHHSNVRMDLHKTPEIVTEAPPKRRLANAASTPTSVGGLLDALPLGKAIADQQRRRESRESEVSEPPPVQGKRGASRIAAQPAMGRPSVPDRGRPRQVAHQDEVYQVIQAYIADFARELNDRAPLKTSTTRAYNLYKRSGLGQDAFVAQLYAARAIVKEQAGAIRSRGADNAAGFPVAHRAAYYFAVLEDLLGLRPESDQPTNGGSASASSQPMKSLRTVPAPDGEATLRSDWSKDRN